MKQKLNEIKRMQQLAGTITEGSVTLNNQYPSLGAYSPEDGDLSDGFKDGCKLLGSLENSETGKTDSLVFEGDNYVCILTIDAGYGEPSISIHDKSVLQEIESRIV